MLLLLLFPCVANMKRDAHADSSGVGVLTDLQFEDEGSARPGKMGATTPLQASHSVRMLCSLVSDPQLVGVNRFQSAGNSLVHDRSLADLYSLPA